MDINSADARVRAEEVRAKYQLEIEKLVYHGEIQSSKQHIRDEFEPSASERSIREKQAKTI